MNPISRVLRPALAAAAVFALVTWLALEGGDVGILSTNETGGLSRETRVWWAEGEGGSLWLEAATPERPWLLDVRRNDAVVLTREGAVSHWRAVPVEGDEARREVRARFRDKYGWADRWVALLQDASEAVAVRLDPRPAR